MRRRIILTVGLPGCGKSTWLARLGVNAISSDEIRRRLADDPTIQTIHPRVFATVRFLLRHRLEIGRPATYIDATSLTRKERLPYLRIARAYDCAIEAVFFDVPLEVCLGRNAARDRVVPEEAMRTLAARLEPPSFEEGFECIGTVR